MAIVLTLVLLAVAALAVFPLTRWLGRRAGWPLAAIYVIALVLALPMAGRVRGGELVEWSMTWADRLGVQIALRVDGLSLLFGGLALLIGAIVFAYAALYLAAKRQLSFYLVMVVFTFAMIGLVVADDLVLLFLCWEMTSLASFLLIARSGSAGKSASLRTLLITFVGGLALLGAVVAMIAKTGTTSLHEVLVSPVWADDPSFAVLVCVLVMVAGFTKAAQFPFHIWLPDAMAAPTPVSAYLHAAAVVKAGIFLLMRFSPAFHNIIVWHVTLVAIGLMTMIIGGWFAIQQTDLKKLMAYSTISQLGLIVATIGVGTEAALTAAMIHTIAHAFFKSGLFMIVGVVDHAVHTRDLRRLPPLAKAMPWTFAVTALGAASMAGIPPLLGFISKESILTAMRDAPGPVWIGEFALAVAVIGAVLTITYCVKIVFGTFVDGTADEHRVGHVEVGLLPLAALPIVAGLPLALVAGVLDSTVASAAGAALAEGVPDPNLRLWHGITVELLLTLAALAIGVFIVRYRKLLWRRLEYPTFHGSGPDVIRRLGDVIARVGRELTALTSVDQPTRYVAAILIAFVVVLGGGLLTLSGQSLPTVMPGATQAIDVVLMVVIAAGVLGTCLSQSRLAATVCLSTVGIFATVQIFALGAADVALTQLLVEGMTVIVIMLVLQKLPLQFSGPPPSGRLPALALALAVGVIAAAGTWILTGRRGHSDIAQTLLRDGPEISGFSNVVNVILVEFRGFDTFGELAVLGIAGVVLVAVLSTVRSRYIDPAPDHDPKHVHTYIPVPQPQLRDRGTTAYRAVHEPWANAMPLQLMLRFLLPALALFSALLLWRGHNAPGGGFIAALVTVSMIGLVYLSTWRDRQIGPPRLPLRLIGGGIIVAVLTGLLGLVAKGSFLAPLHAHALGLHISSSLLFDIGVYFAVIGMVILAFNLLGTSEEIQYARGKTTRERVDEVVTGHAAAPNDDGSDDVARVGTATSFVATGTPPREPGR